MIADELPKQETIPGVLGRFRLMSVLGEGAFGKVYLAEDPLLERQVAVKTPRFDVQDQTSRQRFLREAKTAARLHHPNIVAVYEAGRVADQLYLVAEYVQGPTLSSPDGRPSNMRQAVGWVRQLADALVYAHAEGIIHRDVKPSNVLIAPGGSPQLMDFGLARSLEEDSTLTIDGSLLGSPAYMSPEQASGDVRALSPASDQYSLGVVLFELLAGRTPFQGSPQAVVQQQVLRDPPSPRRFNRRVPRPLETICLKCLAKSPARRYANCGELAADLQRWLDGEAITARKARLGERLFRWSRRHRVAAALSVMAVMLLIAVITVSSLVSARLFKRNQDIQQALLAARAQYRIEQEQLKLAQVQLRNAADLRARADEQAQRALAEKTRAETAVAELRETQREIDAAQTQATADAKLREQAASKAAQESDAGQAAVSAAEKSSQASRKTLAALQPLPVYIQDLKVASDAIKGGNLLVARAQLEVCDSAMRGWEWRYLRDRCSGVKSLLIPSGYGNLAFSQDSTLLADGGRVISTANGNVVTTLNPPKNGPLLFSPDQRELVIVHSGFWIYDLATGKGSLAKFRNHVNDIAFLHNGDLVIRVDDKLFDARTGGAYQRPVDGGQVVHVGRSNQTVRPVTSDCVVFSYGDSSLMLRSLTTGGHRPLEDQNTHSPNQPAAFSPDGRWLICDKTLWDLENNTTKPFDASFPLAISPSGDRVVNHDGVWHLSGNCLLLAFSRRPVRKPALTTNVGDQLGESASLTIGQYYGSNHPIVWSPDGRRIARFNGTQIELISLAPK